MASDSILVLNAGSSSLKFSLFHAQAGGALDLVVRGEVDGMGSPPRLTARDGAGRNIVERVFKAAEVREPEDAIRVAGAWLREELRNEHIIAVGHRIVHGGAKFSKPMLLNDVVCAELKDLVPLAPLHLPHNLAAIHAVRTWQPNLLQVACFDTGFHRTHPQLADLYGLPWEYYEAGVRRYGFHGLSYEYIASALPVFAPEVAEGRVIAAHLGNGASLCALQARRSVDSTMGFSVLDGLAMGTRPGALDPGVLLFLISHRGMGASELETLLYHESGLLGLSGVSNDMRVLLASSQPRARLAIDYFVHRAAKEIGALAASLGGLDGLVFTAGIGENSPAIRARIMERCAWLGLTLDPEANARGGLRISAADSKVSAWVVPTNEELMIARHTLAILKSHSEPKPD
jgi:acetate kinase